MSKCAGRLAPDFFKIFFPLGLLRIESKEIWHQVTWIYPLGQRSWSVKSWIYPLGPSVIIIFWTGRLKTFMDNNQTYLYRRDHWSKMCFLSRARFHLVELSNNQENHFVILDIKKRVKKISRLDPETRHGLTAQVAHLQLLKWFLSLQAWWRLHIHWSAADAKD